ncbi:TPA: hypothetical protein ACTXAP_004504, partial [Raoultella planticola]
RSSFFVKPQTPNPKPFIRSLSAFSGKSCLDHSGGGSLSTPLSELFLLASDSFHYNLPVCIDLIWVR